VVLLGKESACWICEDILGDDNLGRHLSNLLQESCEVEDGVEGYSTAVADVSLPGVSSGLFKGQPAADVRASCRVRPSSAILSTDCWRQYMRTSRDRVAYHGHG
jgi:hypothetical protein